MLFSPSFGGSLSYFYGNYQNFGKVFISIMTMLNYEIELPLFHKV